MCSSHRPPHGEATGVLDRRADQGVASQTARGTVPEHRIASKHIGKRIERNPKAAKIQRFFDVIGLGDHVRHNEGRAYLVHVAIAKPDAPLVEVKLAIGNQTVKAEALSHLVREQLGVVLIRRLQISSKCLSVG